MKLHVHKRSGKFLGSLDVDNHATLDDLKTIFYNNYRYYPERQRFTLESVKGPVVNDGPLSSSGVIEGTTLYFKDLGVQISWRLVFVIEYLGPLLIMPLFWLFPYLFYQEQDVALLHRSRTQVVAFGLFMIHFGKRELESLFVHRFSNATMPIARLPINCSHYWFLCAASIGYFLCHPKYQPPMGDCRWVIYPLAALFLIFEALNFNTHLILRNLRPRGTKERGLPQGCGFQWVSCANYFWETLAWIVFSMLTMCLTSYIFTFVAFAQMLVWALKKHRSYIKTFPNYPRSRRAIIPFLL